MSMNINLFRWLATLLLGVTPASASIVIDDDPVFGLDSITRQVDTNLEWLDPAITIGRSFVDVRSSLDTEFSGFRFASHVEVRSLFDAFGLPPDGTYFTLPFGDLGPLLDAVGTTFSVGNESRGVFGWTGEFSQPGRVIYATAFERFDAGAASTPFQQILSFPGLADNPLPGGPYPDFGSWLVRDARNTVIPEPSTFAIWSLLGLVGAGVQLRRRRKA